MAVIQGEAGFPKILRGKSIYYDASNAEKATKIRLQINFSGSGLTAYVGNDTDGWEAVSYQAFDVTSSWQTLVTSLSDLQLKLIGINGTISRYTDSDENEWSGIKLEYTFS